MFFLELLYFLIFPFARSTLPLFRALRHRLKIFLFNNNHFWKCFKAKNHDFEHSVENIENSSNSKIKKITVKIHDYFLKSADSLTRILDKRYLTCGILADITIKSELFFNLLNQKLLMYYLFIKCLRNNFFLKLSYIEIHKFYWKLK